MELRVPAGPPAWNKMLLRSGRHAGGVLLCYCVTVEGFFFCYVIQQKELQTGRQAGSQDADTIPSG